MTRDEAAVSLADEAGLEELGMRRLVFDTVLSEIELPSGDVDWRAAMRHPRVLVQDTYIDGMAMQEKTLGFEAPREAGDAARRRAESIRARDEHPYLAEIATKLSEAGYDPAVEFAWGMDLILDGLDQLLRTS